MKRWREDQVLCVGAVWICLLGAYIGRFIMAAGLPALSVDRI